MNNELAAKRRISLLTGRFKDRWTARTWVKQQLQHPDLVEFEDYLNKMYPIGD